jgi:hypothetical protein
MSKYDYIRNYLDLNYYTNEYSPERIKLHESIIDNYFINKNYLRKYNKSQKFIFTSGAYGSGKSFVIKELSNLNKINLTKYVYIDPDVIRLELPEYEQLINTDPLNIYMLTNQEAFYIGELIKFHAMFEGLDLIYDSSLRNYTWFESHIKWIRNNFPKAEIIVINVHANWISVLERNLLRTEQSNRFIKLDTIRQSYFESLETHYKIKKIVDKNIIIPNNSDYEAVDYIKENISGL